MHILLTNDDGIFAPGLKALCDAALAAGHRVSVCAPDRERSAASHSVTLRRPLTPRPVAFDGAPRAWAVDGTPADCASLGLFLLEDDPADVVISGINAGMNLGGACIYSGTVAAAMEAAMCGTPGLAVSLCTLRRDASDDYAPAALLGVRAAQWLAEHPLPRGAMLNLNVPALPLHQIRGSVAARLSPVFLGPPCYRRDEAGGYAYVGDPVVDEPRADDDQVKIDEGYATLTVLTWDFRLNADDSMLNGIGF